MERTRVGWIDIFKLLGIIAIFCGHLGYDTGKLHDFVFCYHVPLFFFASGIFAGNLDNLRFIDAVKKRLKQIMLPYSFLVVLNMVLIVITSDKDFITYLKYIKQFIWGIRNQMPASSLWFFSCIFCAGVLFEVLRRLLKKKIWILLASIALYFLSITVFPNRPDLQPSWIWNVDSACYYLIYYAFGYTMHEMLLAERQAIFVKSERSRKWRNEILALTGICFLAGYTLSVYLQEDIIGELLLQTIPGFHMIYPVIRAMLLIFFNLVLAKILENFHVLADMGTQTLWLCGNEMIVKKILSAAVEIVGLQIEITSALSAVLYAVIMSVVIIKCLLPVEKQLYLQCFLKSEDLL